MIAALRTPPDPVAFRLAEPFPHVVIDHFFMPPWDWNIAQAFPKDTSTWIQRRHLHSAKATVETGLPPMVVAAFIGLHSPVFLDWLSRLSGIRPLFPDPDLKGAGMHVSKCGGFLDVHADFEVHHQLGARRALNILIYLTPNWDPEWGGHLELWDRDMRRAVQTIEPRFNRAVIFATSKTSFHGLPTPLRCPEGVQRQSLAGYYYTPWASDAEQEAALTTTDYRPRPWDWEKRARKLARRVLRRVGLSSR